MLKPSGHSGSTGSSISAPRFSISRKRQASKAELLERIIANLGPIADLERFDAAISKAKEEHLARLVSSATLPNTQKEGT